MGGSITVGGKNQIPISAVGQVEFEVVDSKGASKVLKLDDVLYAPQLKFSLLSVPAAVKLDFRFTFKCGVCIINTNQRFSIKANIAEHADLYQFDANPILRHEAHVAQAGKTKALQLLHKRMGHANVRTLQDIPRHNSVLNYHSNAASCRVDFKIHSDICGPLPVPRISGCRCFVDFIDDYARFMVTYAMKSRTELYECYEDVGAKLSMTSVPKSIR
ncbi:TPA: hypothetical protein N0F65_005090 [Lagenidium giganteum]|uniref:Retrovirus-related Pol polyprotein from transposon TNT 1-94-like beta-barrel domain-containing protein n=1 Tax=Lagenidium giganteum TaxID=4803 RepID=A0AAV2Z3I7_9STRA|nr:TPA: hypothetical protein N0F65_005090 [Lagenidium giganteum]